MFLLQNWASPVTKDNKGTISTVYCYELHMILVSDISFLLPAGGR